MSRTPNGIQTLRTEIDQELKELERLEEEIFNYLEQLDHEPENMELRALGSSIHDFYSGVEKIFELIAENIDEDIPEGKDWHNRLLMRMQGEVEGIRPPVITEELKESLEEYLRFRHLFRNIYGYKLKWSRLKELVEQFPEVLEKVKRDMNTFYEHLTKLKTELEKETRKSSDQDNT